MEVIDAEEESDTAGCLVTHNSALTVAIRSGEKKSRLRARRSYDDPPLGAPVIRQRWRVLHEVEAQHSGEESDRGIVVVDDQGNQVDLHRSSLEEIDGRTGTDAWAIGSSSRPPAFAGVATRLEIVAQP
jgi:hypothetical protein